MSSMDVNNTHTYKKSTIIKKNSDKPIADKSRHYVDKQAFYEALVERADDVAKAEAAGLDKPKPSDFIGVCVMDICINLAKKYQFSGYHFKDEMIADAIYHCIRYIDSFNIEKSENPFSYFTQAAYYQFIKRIQMEKEQLYIKCKSTVRSTVFNSTAEKDEAKNDKNVNENIDMDTEFMDSFIDEYELKDREKKAKAKETKRKKDVERASARDTKFGLDQLIEDE
jgi:hypothetical protein